MQASSAALLGFAAANQKRKLRHHMGSGIGWMRLGTGSVRVAVARPRGGEVGYLSQRDNTTLGSLFCNIIGTPKGTLKAIVITNLGFLMKNIPPKVLSNKSLKVCSNTLNHLSPLSDLRKKNPHPISNTYYFKTGS